MLSELLILLMMIIFMKFINLYLISNLLFLLTFMFLFKINWLDWSLILLNLSMSFYSLSLMILTLWIFALIFMNLKQKMNNKFYLFLIFIMMLFMLLLFISMNFLLFYLMFEISLLLIFMLIMNWGYSMNRILASFYLMFYTMIFSLPLLMIIMYLLMIYNNLNFKLMELNEYNMNISMFMFMYMLLSFLVKIPLYLMHSWLLKAHVEATYYMSMILASIMLKLGCYGLLRLMFIFKNYFLKIKYYILIISLMGTLILSLLCLRQLDMKMIVAMSSIIHMNLMLMGMMTFSKLGINGSYLMMISHGLTSSGLFYLIEMIYKQTNSRLLMMNKGLINMSPVMVMMWFLICTSNVSAPFSLNLISELMLLMSLISYYKNLILFMYMYCLLSFIYSIYLFSSIIHGSSYPFFHKKNMNGKMINYLTVLFHWIPLNLLVFNLDMMI